MRILGYNRRPYEPIPSDTPHSQTIAKTERTVSKLLGIGKSKRVFSVSRDLIPPGKKELQSEILVTAKGRLKVAELKKEFQIRKEIKRRAKNSDVSKHLAIEGEIVPKKHWINGLFTYRDEDLSGTNLEKKISSKGFDSKTKLNWMQNLLKGLTFLQNTHCVHGDIKLDNIFFPPNNDTNPKIGDYGKSHFLGTLPQTPGYRGNLRYAPPEGIHSLQGDVYSMGVVFMRICEEAIPGFDGESLLEVDEHDDKKAIEGRRGVEKFIVEHKAFPGIDEPTLKDKIFRSFPRRMRLFFRSKKAKEKQGEVLKRYLNAIKHEWKKHQIFVHDEDADAFFELIEKMIDSDPKKRPPPDELESAFAEFSPLLEGS